MDIGGEGERRGGKVEEGRRGGLKEEDEEGKKRRRKRRRRKETIPHAVISLSKSSSVFAQCVNENFVKPFSCHCSINHNIYVCSTGAYKRSLCTVSFPNR